MLPSRKKSAAIIQSNYIPWKGYFDVINSVDEFILFDDVQYTRRDWRNRNQIITPAGREWLTIPVLTRGKYEQRIDETLVSESDWAERHWATLKQRYARAACFRQLSSQFEAIYVEASKLTRLSDVNHLFLKHVCSFLEIPTRISWSSDYPSAEGKTARLIGLCQSVGATRYLSGPAAKAYLEPHLFEQAGIELAFMEYDGYPVYRQLSTTFEHGVSILDLIFNEGKDAPLFMKSFGAKAGVETRAA